jgi:HPr kinase/phosphorylase
MDEPLHASLFAYQGAGCLLIGASGTGKSRLTAEAIAQGAKFIADDRVQLSLMQGLVTGSPVPNLAGVIELRGFGLIKIIDYNQRQVIRLIVELAPGEVERVPPAQTRELLGVEIPYLRLPPVPGTNAAALLFYIRAMQDGRLLPPDWSPHAN